MGEVRKWLLGCGLGDYVQNFENEGWERFEDLESIEDGDLKACISKAGHRQHFRTEMKKRRHLATTLTPRSSVSSDLTPRSSVSSDILPEATIRTALDVTDRESDDDSIVLSMQSERQWTEENSNDTENSVPSPYLTTFGGSPDSIEGSIGQLVPSAHLHIKHSENTRYYSGCNIFEERNGQKEYFKAQMETMVKSYEGKDKMYVETRAFQELVHIIEDRHMAVIIGLPGDGKTTMAYHLSLKYYNKGYEHLELHFAKDWKEYVDGTSGKGRGRKQFVIIDDIFGRMSVDERKLSEWISMFDLIQNIVAQREGDLIVVCTCRKYVYMDVRTKLSRFRLFQVSFLVDMASKRLAVNKEEKKSIWDKYAKEYNVKAEAPNCINNGFSNPHGFPHCVELFCTDYNLQRQGECFFENPMKCVEEQITYFMNDAEERLKYCVLLMVLLRGNKFEKRYLDDLSAFRRTFQAAGLSTCPTKIDLLNALSSLTNTYITDLGSYYRISHDSVRENIAFMFIKSNKIQAIQELNFIYLTDHTRCSDQNKEDEETIVVLEPEYNNVLANRMTKEIINGNVVAVCAHKAWESISFLEEFMKCALSSTNSGSPDVSVDPRSIFNTKDSSSLCIFYYNLFEALEFFKHGYAVKRILENASLKPLLQDVSVTSSETPVDKSISNKLCNILDSIGYGGDTRRFLRESNTTMEVLDTLCIKLADRDFSCNIFGSQSEGTQVTTQKSKLDACVSYLFCRNDCEVIHDISDTSPKKKLDLLMVSDEISRPGYVKLQIVLDGVPQTTKTCKHELPENTKPDYKSRICVYQTHPDMLRVDKHMGLETTTKMITGGQSDILYESYRCGSWPDVAKSWHNRARHYNWPSRYDLEQMKTLGILLVPVGCFDSIERHLEFKICFLLQERYLMDNLNHTQHKCYVLLKMINNSIISLFVKEPALVSYHLKMCLFNVIENTDGDIWVPRNLLSCVRHCLNCVLKCAISGMCANYFIPEENLFRGRIHGELQSKLRNVLEMLLKGDFEFLLHIQCGNVGSFLEKSIRGSHPKIGVDHAIVSDSIESYIERDKFIVLVKDRILSRCYDKDIAICVQQHLNMLQRLREIDSLAEHSNKETQRALELALPYVELSFMNNLVAWTVKEESCQMDIEDVLYSQQWNDNAKMTNSFSAKLKQATYMHLLGFRQASLQILETLKGLLDPCKISICGCRFFLNTVISNEVKTQLKQKSEEEFRIKQCMPCLVFLPTELVPEAVRKEMNSTETASMSGSTPYRFGNNWAVVDSKVLLFYLLYLNHSKLQMATEALEDIENLLEVLETDPNLGHKEIGWNILGWIYSQEGHHDRAQMCFEESSLQLEAYNAAQRQYMK